MIFTSTKETLLIDMDEVLVDFSGGVFGGVLEIAPELEPYLHRNTRKFDPKIESIAKEIFNSQGFFRNLKPNTGAAGSILFLETIIPEIQICTTPVPENQWCIEEKREWIFDNLGNHWLNRIIFVEDKTLVPGKALIDDKPNIKGKQTPSWKHILFTQNYNLHINANLRLDSWDNRKSILEILSKAGFSL